MTGLTPYMVAFIAGLLIFGFSKLQSNIEDGPDIDLAPERDKWDYGPIEVTSCFGPDEEGERIRITDGVGPTVRAWPSKGGFYELESCDGVELDFLKLDQVPPPSSGPETAAEEEALCNRLRQLGAVWWESNRERVMDWLNPDPHTKRPQPFLKVGWPAGGGVWVLELPELEAHARGCSIIRKAHDMEERCRLIEQLGGVFYENPKDWLDVEILRQKWQPPQSF